VSERARSWRIVVRRATFVVAWDLLNKMLGAESRAHVIGARLRPFLPPAQS